MKEPNVDFARQGDTGMTERKVRGVLCNPVNAGVWPYPAIVDDATWVAAATSMIKQEGAEQFLVNMLFMLRRSIEAAPPPNTTGES
jgi:hypothetical protein